MSFRQASDIDFAQLTGDRTFHPSPSAWEDEVLYFLMVDRFADGNENTPLLTDADKGTAWRTEESRHRWQQAGAAWVGGALAGLRGELGYLQRLGVTAVGRKLRCLFNTDPGLEGLSLPVQDRNGRAVEVTVPAGGFVIYG